MAAVEQGLDNGFAVEHLWQTIELREGFLHVIDAVFCLSLVPQVIWSLRQECLGGYRAFQYARLRVGFDDVEERGVIAQNNLEGVNVVLLGDGDDDGICLLDQLD